jgi:hypothetical protein
MAKVKKTPAKELEQKKEYYRKNRESILAKQKERREAKKNEPFNRKEYNKQYYKKNKERLLLKRTQKEQEKIDLTEKVRRLESSAKLQEAELKRLKEELNKYRKEKRRRNSI